MSKRKRRLRRKKKEKKASRLLTRFERGVRRLSRYTLEMAFVVGDVFKVNFLKSPLTTRHCRGKHEHKGCPCPTAEKYHHVTLFQRFVCKDCRPSRKQHTRCRPSKGPTIQPVRGLIALLVVLLPITVVGFGIVRFRNYTRYNAETSRGIAAGQEDQEAEESLELGHAAYAAGDYQGALDHFRSVLHSPDIDSVTLHKVAVCYKKTGRPDRALSTWNAAVSVEEPYGPALNAISIALYVRGNVGGAAQQAQRAIELGLADGTTEAILADRRLWAGEIEKARAHLQLAEIKGAAENIHRLVKAHLLLLQGSRSEALRLLKMIPEGQPTDLMASLYRLELLWQRDGYQEAIEQLQRAIDRQPDQAWTELLITGVRFAAGQRAPAREQARKVIHQYEHDPALQLQLARMLRWHGETDWALEIALRHKDEIDFRVRARLFAAEIFLKHSLPRRALNVLSIPVVERSDDLRALKARGTVGLALDDTSTALECFTRILDKTPNSASVHFLLAATYRKRNAPEKALQELEITCRLEPESDKFRRAYAAALNEAGQSEKAKEYSRSSSERLAAPSETGPGTERVLHPDINRGLAETSHPDAVALAPIPSGSRKVPDIGSGPGKSISLALNGNGRPHIARYGPDELNPNVNITVRSTDPTP